MKKALVVVLFLFLMTCVAICGLVQEGDSLQSKGDFDGAISNYTKAIQLNQDAAEAYNNRGNAERAKGDLDSAIADYSQALTLQTNYANAYLNRGNVKSQKGDLDGAITDYGKAIEFKPDVAIAYCSRGNTKFIKGDLNGAIADYNKAVELKPDYPDVLFNRRFAEIQKGDAADQASDRMKYLALLSNSPAAYFKSGNIESTFDLDMAILDFSNAVRLDRNFAAAFENMGYARYNRSALDSQGGDWDQFSIDLKEAIVDYSIVIQIQPTNSGAYIYRAQAEQRRHYWPDAIADFKAALNMNLGPDTEYFVKTNLAVTYCTIAFAEMLTNDSKSALVNYGNAIAVQPDNAFAFWKRGLIKSINGDTKGAMADFNGAINAQPDYTPAYAARGLLKFDQGDLTGAMSDENQALTLKPGDAYVLYNRGIIKARESDFTGARADFQNALDLLAGDNRGDSMALKSQVQESIDKLRGR
jgi:tetratricopeptide (TPR) repeat protein